VGETERVAASWAGLVVGTGMALSGVGSSAAAVALPSVRDAFDLGPIGTAWVLGAFVVGVAATAPIYGRLADRFGTRSPFAVGLVLFAIGSVISAIAMNPAVLYAGRGLQGIGAGTFPVLGAITVASLFDGQERTEALARVAALAVGAALGVLIGGLLDAWWGWRAVMAFPAIIVLIIPATVRLAPSFRRRVPTDPLGALLVTLGVLGLVLVLQGPKAGAIVVEIGSALLVVSLVGLFLHVRRTPDGLLPRAVVTNRVFLLTALGGSAVPGLYYSGLILVPQELASIESWGPVGVGVALLGPSLLGVAFPRIAVRIGALAPYRAPFALVLGGLGLLLGAVFTSQAWALLITFTATCTAFGIAQGALVDRISTYVEGPRGGVIGSYTLLFFLGGALSSGLCGLLAATWSPTVAFAVLGIMYVVIAVVQQAAWNPPERAVIVPATE